MLCAMWDLGSWCRDEPMPPAVGARSLNHWTAREVPPLQPFLSAHFSGIQCLHSVVQGAPRPSLELFHFAKLKLRARHTVTPHPLPPAQPLGSPPSTFCLSAFGYSVYLI